MGEKDESVIVHDPYDGIFYNTEETEDKTIIQFVSVLLFRLLLNKMQSDFQLPTDVHIYRLNTRKQKVKCHIVLNAVTNSIEVSEAGHRAWKIECINKTIPSLMSQLVEKTNEGIDLPVCANKDQIQNAEVEPDDVIVVDVQESSQVKESAAQSNDANAFIINKLTNLQAQIQQIRDERNQRKHTCASVASTDPKVSPKPASSTSSSKTQTSAIQNKPGQRNSTNAGTKPVRIIPSEKDQIATTESDKGSPSSVGNKIPTIRKSTLLVGDSIINRVNPRGLKYNVHKHVIAGATISTLMNEVQLFDLSRIDTIIVYVGGNDIANHQYAELIEEHYDQFVATLRASNPNLKVILSKVAPRGDVDVSPLNCVIERLCAHHKLESVDIFRAFHDKNGMVCMRYVSQQDTIHPSASGIKRLLGTINSKIDIVHNFDNAVFSHAAGNKSFHIHLATLITVHCKHADNLFIFQYFSTKFLPRCHCNIVNTTQ